MKTINLDFLAKDQTIYCLVLAYMYDEIKDYSRDNRRQLIVQEITKLDQMTHTYWNINYNNSKDYYDSSSLEHLVSLAQVLNIYDNFKNVINFYFPEYKEIKIIGSTGNLFWEDDLNKIGIKYYKDL